MSRGQTLLLVSASSSEAPPSTMEAFLRVAVGLLAGGHRLQTLALHALGPLPADAEPYLEALAEEELSFVPPPSPRDELRAALRRCDNLVRLAAPDRPGRPALLRIDAQYLDTVTQEQLCTDLGAAGQVIRIP